MRNKDVYILIKRSVQQEDITIDIYAPNIRSVQFSPSVVSNSLLPHGLQYVRFPCPSPTPRACSNSCPLESVMPYNHFILCPLLLLPSLFPSINSSVLSFLSEKAMAPRSSTLAWKIPWMEEPGGLQSMGSLRVGHDWATSLSLFTCMHWRRKWQSTPVFLPGESQGWGSLGGLPSVGSHRVGHDWSDLAAATAAAYIYLLFQSLFPFRL